MRVVHVHAAAHLPSILPALIVSAVSMVACPDPAQAQSGQGVRGVYVEGLVLADLQRSSGQVATGSTGFTGVTKLDGTTVGAGIRGGAFLTPRWSLEVGVDVGGKIESASMPLFQPLTTGAIEMTPIAVLLPAFESRVTARTTATSVVIGYHPPARGRVRPGFVGGLGFMHTASTYTQTVQYTLMAQRQVQVPPRLTPIATTTEAVANQVAATVGGELALALSERAAVVPEIRAQGFDGRFVIRPGVAVRWQW